MCCKQDNLKNLKSPQRDANVHSTFHSVGCTNTFSTRTARTSLPLHGYVSCQQDKPQNFKVSLMRCKSPLDRSLCRVDKHFVHSYGSYDSTTITRGLLPTRQATKFLSLPNEMQQSTRQFTLSTRIMSTVLDNPPSNEPTQNGSKSTNYKSQTMTFLNPLK